MTYPRYLALVDSWRTEPPAALTLALIATALGWKPPAARTAAAKSEADLQRDMAALAALGFGMTAAPLEPPP